MKRRFSEFFKVRVQSVPMQIPLAFDVYLNINSNCVLFRRKKEAITEDRMKALLDHKLREFYIPIDQREAYLDALKDLTRDDTLKKEVRGKYIKESAFNHIHDLFTKPDIKELVTESEGLIEEMVNFISADVEAAASLMRLSTHDYYTYNHSVNVAVYTIAIAKKIIGDDKELLITAGLGGLLHDLGKRKVDVAIINKPGRLTPEEWEEIKKHPDYGVELLGGLSDVPEGSKRIVHEHHENVDGSGYPRGLDQDQIAQLARVSAIADVFDALTTKRAYKDAVSAQKALEIMFTMQPGKFDESLFKYFDRNLDRKTEVTIDKHFDPCSPLSKIKKVS